MPRGFHIASAWVDITAETDGLREKVTAAVKEAVRGQKIEVPMDVNNAGFREKVSDAVSRAQTNQKINVALGISSKGLRKQVSDAVKAAAADQKPLVPIGISSKGLRGELSRAIKKAAGGEKIKIPIGINSVGLRGELSRAVAAAAAGEDINIPVHVNGSAINRALAGADPEITPDINMTGMRAKLRAALSGLDQNTTVHINPDLDTAMLRAQIAAITGSQRGIHINADIDMAHLNAQLQAAARMVPSDIDIDLNPRMNALRAHAEISAAVRAASQGITVPVRPELQTRFLQASLRASLAGRGFQIPVIADLRTAEADRQIAVLAARLRSSRLLQVPIRVNTDEDSAIRAMRRLEQATSNSAGNMSRITKLVLAGVVLIPPAIAASVTALESVGPAAAVSIPMLSSMALVLGTVAVGGNGVAHAIAQSGEGAKQFKEALEMLTPTAQDFVLAVVSSKSAFKDLQQSVQNIMFDGLDDSFRDMAHTTIPDLRIGLGGTAMQINEMGKSTFSAVTSLSKLGLLKTMFGGLQLAFAPLIPMPGQFLGMLTRMTIAATPMLIRMTTSLGNGMNTLEQKINQGFESGRLQMSIDKAGDAFMKFFRNIGNNPEWTRFIQTMERTGPSVARTLAIITEALMKMLNNLGPVSGVLLKIAEVMARIVIAMPDSFITSIISLVAAFKLLGLTIAALRGGVAIIAGLQAAMALLASRAVMMQTIAPALRAIGVSYVYINRAAAALQLLGKATVGLAVIAGIAYAFDRIGESATAATPDVGKLQSSLIKLNETGKFSGELSKSFGDIKGLQADLKNMKDGVDENIDAFSRLMTSNTSGHGDQTGISGWIKKTIDNLENGDKSVESSTKKWGALDDALAELAKSGNTDIAAGAIKKFGISTKDSAKYLDNYNNVLQENKLANDLAAATMGQFGEQAARTGTRLDALKQDTDGLTKSLFALNNAGRDAESAVGDFEKASDDLVAAAKKGSVGLSYQNGLLSQNNDKQREAADLMEGVAAKAETAGTAIIANGGSWQQASQFWSQGHDQIVQNGIAFGLSKAEAEAYANSILRIPTEHEILMQVTGDADAQLQSVASAFRAAPDQKTINVSVLNKPAIAALEQMGLKVQQLPDGTFNITATDKGAKNVIDALEKRKIDPKEVQLTADAGPFNFAFSAADRKKFGKKVAPFSADAGAFMQVWGTTQAKKLSSKTSKFTADPGLFNQKKSAADRSSLKGHTSTFGANTSPFYSAVARVNAARLASKVVTVSMQKVGSWLGFGATGGAVSGLRKHHVPGFANGGSISGGVLSGPGNKLSDSITAQLSRGEFVMQARAVDKYGAKFMTMINAGMFPKLPGFAKGGMQATAGSPRTSFATGGKVAAGSVQSKEGLSALQGVVTVSALTQKAIKLGHQIDNETMAALRAQDNLGDLLSGLQTTKNAIAAAFKGPAETGMLNKLNATADKLIPLQDKLDGVNKSLDAAKTSLTDLKGKFDDLKGSVSASIVAYGNITKVGAYGTSTGTLISQLQADVNKATAFSNNLTKLKSMGVSSDLINQIATAGIGNGGDATAASLVNATPAQIAQLNALQKQLQGVGDKAGTTVADSMYGAGVAAAQGLVNGLQSQQDAIEASMRKIAQSLIDAINTKLGIHSPSTVMHQAGVYTGEGFDNGVMSKKKDILATVGSLTGGVTSAATSTSSSNSDTMGGGCTYNFNVTINGSDLTSAKDRRAIAKSLVDDMKEEIRLSDMKRR